MSRRGAKRARLNGKPIPIRTPKIKATLTEKKAVDVRGMLLHMLQGVGEAIQHANGEPTLQQVRELILQRMAVLEQALAWAEGRELPPEQSHENPQVSIRLWRREETSKPEQVLICVQMEADRMFTMRLRAKDGAYKFVENLASAVREVWPQ